MEKIISQIELNKDNNKEYKIKAIYNNKIVIQKLDNN